MHYWLVIIPMTMKLCWRGMSTKTFNIHDLHVCKQQQTASGNKSCKLIIMPITSVPDYETWYNGTQYHSNVKTTFTCL